MDLNGFEREIIQVTNCNPEDAEEIYNYLRITYGDLGSMKFSRFVYLARRANTLLTLLNKLYNQN